MNSSIPKRLAAWQAAHGQLLRSDTQYKKRFHVFLAVDICLSCVLLVFYLPFFGIRLFSPIVDISIILAIATVIVVLSFRQFHFQRQSIRRYLQSIQIV